MWRLSKKHTHKQVHRLNPEGKYLGHEEGSFFFFFNRNGQIFFLPSNILNLLSNPAQQLDP